MEFNKYSSSNDKINLKVSNTETNNNNTNNEYIYTRGGVEINRTLWGNIDDGLADIDDSMWVNGSIFVKSFSTDEDEGDDDKGDWEDDDDNIDLPIDETDGGSIFAEDLIKSKRMEAKEIFATEHLYIRHPETEVKTDIMDLFKDFDALIKANTAEINKLKTRVSNNETNINIANNNINRLSTTIAGHTQSLATHTEQINTNKNNIKTNTDNIKTNTEEINKLKATINDPTKQGDNLPSGTVIMFNGEQNKIPSGWVICDGKNGTPNLIDRFVKGGKTPGNIGGSNEIYINKWNLPPHDHTVNKALYGRSDNANDRDVITYTNTEIKDADAVKTSIVGEGQPIIYNPPFYTLIYIMKL